jgi:nucleotide-binding universal stress UspA family protein
MTDSTTPTLLLSYDGSDRAEHAIEQAARLFPHSRAHVVHVWESWEHVIATHYLPGTYAPLDLPELDRRAAEESAALADQGAASAEGHGLSATAHSVPMDGSLWQTVARVADSLGADMIVTGTRGLHGLRELVGHSLTHQLEQHGERPVLAIPLQREVPKRPDGHRRRPAGHAAAAGVA